MSPHPRLLEMAAETTANFARLYNREISFGEFNRLRSEMGRQGLAALMEESARNNQRVGRGTPSCQFVGSGQYQRVDCR